MGVPQDDPMSTEPIYYLNWKEGVERLVQYGYIAHTNDQDGIAFFENMYREQHVREWSNKWLRNNRF